MRAERARGARALLTRLAGGRGLRPLVGRSGWSLASTIITTLAIFTETIILARHLGPSVYGVFLLVVAFPEAVLQVLDLRVREAMNRFVGGAFATDDRPGVVSLLKLFWLLDAAVGLVCLVIVFAAAGPAAHLLTGDPEHAELMRLMALGLFVSTLDSAAGTILRILDRFRLAFFASAGGMLVRLALVAAAVLASGTLEAVVLARAAAEVFFTVMMVIISLVVLKPMLWDHRRTPIRALDERRAEILRFLLSTNMTGTLKMAATKLDTMLLGVLATPASVAVYRFALQFARAPMLVADALNIAFFPTFAKLAALGRNSEMRRMARGASAVLAVLVLPACAVAAIFGGDLLGLLGGERYETGATVFALCLAGVAPSAILFWQGPVILSAGHPNAQLKAHAVGTVAQIALLVALVPALGAEGAALAFTVGLLLVLGMQSRFLSRSGVLHGEPARG